MHEALKSAAKLALRPYVKRGWSVQMHCTSATDCTILYGKVDLESGEEVGVRVTTSLVRTATDQRIAVEVKLI